MTKHAQRSLGGGVVPPVASSCWVMVRDGLVISTVHNECPNIVNGNIHSKVARPRRDEALFESKTSHTRAPTCRPTIAAAFTSGFPGSNISAPPPASSSAERVERFVSGNTSVSVDLTPVSSQLEEVIPSPRFRWCSGSQTAIISAVAVL